MRLVIRSEKMRQRWIALLILNRSANASSVFFLFFSLTIKDKTNSLHLRQGSFTRKVRTIFTLKIIVSIFVKLFLILVLHLGQFFIVRFFVKRATGLLNRRTPNSVAGLLNRRTPNSVAYIFRYLHLCYKVINDSVRFNASIYLFKSYYINSVISFNIMSQYILEFVIVILFIPVVICYYMWMNIVFFLVLNVGY